MSNSLTSLAVLATVAVLLGYEVVFALAQRRRPERCARSVHALLRQQWFEAVSAQKGSEILAVQTLRNSLMSATMMASTAALGLMCTATLAVPSLHAGLGDLTGSSSFTARLALELLLMGQLFASLVVSVMAVRYYNHAGFISAMPVDSDARKRWADTGAAYVRRAGILYSWGLRHLLLVAPILASILQPMAGPVAAVLVVAALVCFDRFDVKQPVLVGG